VDILEYYFKYASEVAEAMTKAGIVPPEQSGYDIISSVMVIVAKSPKGQKKPSAPIGGGINYNKDKKAWEVQVDVSMGEQVAMEDEQ